MNSCSRIKTTRWSTCALVSTMFILLALIGCGSGGSDGAPPAASPSEKSPPKLFASYDVNGDGHFDLVELSLTTQGTNLTRVMLNTGDGAFLDAPPQAFSLSDTVKESLAAAAMQRRSPDDRSRIRQVVVRDEDGSTKSIFLIR